MTPRKVGWKKWTIRMALLAVVGFALIQVIPYGWNRTNPPVLAEPAWDSPQTRQLANDACFACHSNETTWPWYTRIAPFSWLAYKDVVDGRKHLNFSEWPSRGGNDAARQLLSGEMPPIQYKLLHPESRLSDQQIQQLADGLRKTIPGSR